MKNICILGSTGSIGKNALEVIANFPDMFRVTYLTANKNIGLLQEQINRFQPKGIGVLDSAGAAALNAQTNGSIKMFTGDEGLCDLVRQDDIDIVVSSMVGFAGLKPTIEAIKQSKTIALANKETLVVAGEIITALAKKYHATIIPVDSEHSAIMQCLEGEDRSKIAKLILTASGGPFLNMDKKDFPDVSIASALKHPNWNMGKKITIDSATMMNKGLEVIEAHWLFNLPAKKIEVIIHPQSIIHSMVEFIDGSIKAQLGAPDMKLPIQYALTYPERMTSNYVRVDFAGVRQMSFSTPDSDKFECLELAYHALNEGGTTPAILNAANETAVELFLQGSIRFHQIPVLIRNTMEAIKVKHSPAMDDIIEADKSARSYALKKCKQLA
ncbi:MAG: 1-deoxy-D-xylulose-5-phosphate reductoisomerase [Bacteroidota bacterium]